MKSPGPRCTAHAAQTFKSRLTRLTELRNSGGTAEQIARAVSDMRDAADALDATPGGQRSLKERIDLAPSGLGRDELTARLNRGEATRAAQIAAYQAAQGTHNKENDDEQLTGRDRTGTDPTGPGGVPASGRVEPGMDRPGEGQVRGDLVKHFNRGSDQPRVLIEGREVRTVGSVECPPHRVADLIAQGMPTPTLHELHPDEAGAFRGLIGGLKEGNRFHASVYVYDEQEYAAMRLFVTDDGKAGVALKGDEVVSVFARTDSAHTGCGRSLIATAVANGGRRLDCFDTALPRLYAREGFTPVARVRWDDEYAPPGWDYDTYSEYNGGRPDVVFMAYNPNSIGSTYDGGGTPMPDYDAAVSATKAVAHGQPGR